METDLNVRGFIENLPKRGRITFSMEDVMYQFPFMSKDAIRSSIYRLIRKGRVCSVWRSFYIVVPDEYALRGFVPPIEFVDNLMNYLGHKYYVGLLSAAALHGSGHQQPQSFMVVTDSNDIRNEIICFIAKAKISENLLKRKNASYGEIFISDPVMTALDLVLYENRVGGLERAALVIDGLIQELDITGSDCALWTAYPIPVIQRFGFIIESILGYSELGNTIYNKISSSGIIFRKSLLAPRTKSDKIKEFAYDGKWKIIINDEIGTDL